MNLAYNKEQHAIEVNVSFAFENQPLFFRHATCNFSNPALHFIMGKNGIGKSTFFNILQGKIEKNQIIQGSIKMQGITYDMANKQTHALLQNTSRLVAQDYNSMLATQFSVATNISASRLPTYPTIAPLSQAFAYKQMLLDAGITLDKQVDQLSGGQRQILAIIMTLQKPVQLLLLDEPTAALDETNARMVMEFLMKLAGHHNITIVCISHDREIIRAYSQNSYHEIVKNSDDERYIEKRNMIIQEPVP